MEILNKLNQKPPFIEKFRVYDFKTTMGKLALELKYTNGKTQMLTTPSTRPENTNDKGDFSTEDEFLKFIEYLKKHNVKQKS